MALTRFFLCDRWGQFLEELVVSSAEHYQEINGEDTLSIEIGQPLSKGDRVLWQDGEIWHEHVFDGGTQEHDGPETYSYDLVNSLQWDLSLRQIRYTLWESAPASYSLGELIKLHPAWRMGSASVPGTKTVELQKMSAYDGLLELCGLYNCEIEKSIKVGKDGVTSRTVSLKTQIGQERGIRFDYNAGLYGVSKEILDEPVLTAAYGLGGTPERTEVPGGDVPGGGMGEETEEPEPIWCYVTNDASLKTWGLLDGSGGAIHAEGIFEDTEITDEGELRQATVDYLNKHAAPSISYETEIPYASIAGAYLGDTIQVVDAEFTPELRLEARIGAMRRDALTRKVESATFGTVTSLLPDALARALNRARVETKTVTQVSGLSGTVDSLKDQVSDLDKSTSEQLGSLQQENQSLRETIEDLAKRLEALENPEPAPEPDPAT